jgi:uncharacterized repeat protein (TIGR01451 family)
MKDRRFAWAALAAAAALLLPLQAATAAAAAPGTPQFDKCLAKNGLTAAPADQAGHAVQVCKTVRVTRITTYDWTLAKTPSPGALTLAPGETGSVAYTLAATATPRVRWVVDGDVVVRNVGSGDASVTRVVDELRLADGVTEDKTLSSKPFTLSPSTSECPCVCPPEKVFHYSFTVDSPPATGTNTATAEWTEKAKGTSGFSAPVDFGNGPDTNSAVYFRTATVTEAYAAPPAGLLVGVADRPGPFTLTANEPSTLSVTLTSPIRNESLDCPESATVSDTATLVSRNRPEETNNPTSSGSPPSVSLSATATVQVTATGCGAPGAPGPPSAPPSAGPPTQQVAQTPSVAGAPGPAPLASSQTTAPQPQTAAAPPSATPEPGAAPVPPVTKPQPAARPVCVPAALTARIAGPRRIIAGQRVTWRITVRNVGRPLATSVVLTNRIPSGFSMVGSLPRARFVSGVARVRLPNLARGESATVRLTMQASRGIAGQRQQQVRVASGCNATEAARAPITVTAVAGAITPAVTG